MAGFLRTVPIHARMHSCVSLCLKKERDQGCTWMPLNVKYTVSASPIDS